MASAARERLPMKVLAGSSKQLDRVKAIEMSREPSREIGSAIPNTL
jgi:hypothetical protein